jgi:hypothetical protein
MHQSPDSSFRFPSLPAVLLTFLQAPLSATDSLYITRGPNHVIYTCASDHRPLHGRGPHSESEISRLLQAAIHLAQELNFSRAAERLHIEQSALSKQIYELENEVGVRLFDRDHHFAELTDAGRASVEEA